MHQGDPPPRERPNDGTSETATVSAAGAERSETEPLVGRTQLHVSGYGGRMGKPRTSSDQRQIFDEDIPQQDGVDARHSPFYDWLDNAAIRELVHRIHELSVGERLVLVKGLVPGLVGAMGLAEFDAFLSEISIKARRFQEAVDHPGDGRERRVTRGEELGGPTPAGHDHLPTARDPDHRGAREAERVTERNLWARGEAD